MTNPTKGQTPTDLLREAVETMKILVQHTSKQTQVSKDTEYFLKKAESFMSLPATPQVQSVPPALTWQQAKEKVAVKYRWESWELLRARTSDIEQYLDEAAHLFMEANRLQRWIPVEERTPDLIEGEDYSEKVVGLVCGEPMIMTYNFLFSEIQEECGYIWVDECGELDDYAITHWKPIGELPEVPKQ